MDKIRTILLVVLLLSAAAAGAQEQGEFGDEVSDSAEDIAEFIVEKVSRRASERAEILLNLSPYSFEGRRSSLGELLSAEVRTELIEIAPASISVLANEYEELLLRSNPGFSMPAADFVIAGKIVRLDRVLRVHTSVIDPQRGTIFASHQSELQLNSAMISMLSAGEMSQAADLYEPDSMDNPDAIAAGEQISDHTLAPSGDEDWFVYEAGRDQQVVSFGTRGDLDTVITVYTEDDRYTPIAQNDDFNDMENARAAVVTEPGKRYLFRVSGYDDSEIGPYTVYAEAQEIDDPLELNNSRNTASDFPLDWGRSGDSDWATDRGSDAVAGGVVDTQFFPQGDVDWFRFSVPPGRNPQLIIETHSDIDPMLRLYSADGAEIASDDDSGNGYNARISQQLAGGRVYYIEVSEIDAAVGSYRLEIREF